MGLKRTEMLAKIRSPDTKLLLYLFSKILEYFILLRCPFPSLLRAIPNFFWCIQNIGKGCIKHVCLKGLNNPTKVWNMMAQ